MESKNNQILTSLPLPNRIVSLLVGDRPGNLLQLWALIAVTIVALLVHSYNMFGYPLYLGDEGIYMEQAYAVVKLGKLAPYTYFYDHAPAGWLQLATWSALLGNFYTFGTSIDGGRVFILLLQVAKVLLLFRIVLQLTGNTFVATTTGLLFALSPLGFTFGRMVVLDNIMTFWALVAIALLLEYNGNILRLLLSGFCFGLAVLTKENAILMLPGFIYGIWFLVNRDHARFARAAWLFAAISTISTYFLFAVLNNELIPSSDRVSLIGSLFWQSGRKGGVPWSQSSAFFHALTAEWLERDLWLLAVSVVATLWNVLQGDPKRRLIGLMSLLMILSIARDAPVLYFYIASVLPLLVLNVGIAIESLMQPVRSLLPAALVILITLSCLNLSKQLFMFTINPTLIQRQTVAWVQEHIPPDSRILIDDYIWIDLHEAKGDKPIFPYAHSHWKIASDPEIYHNLLRNDWRNIDYLILNRYMKELFVKEPDKLPYKAYINSTSVTQFQAERGWGIEEIDIRRVNDLSGM